MEIDKKLHEEIKEYCKLNGLKTAEYVNSLLKKAFMLDKYGVSPFSKERTPIIGNDAFEEAVNDEVRRILNDPKEFEEVAKKFNQKFFKGTDELDTAMRKFNETFFHGMKEAQETGKEISDYMEKNNLEPVSMDELIYGDSASTIAVSDDRTYDSTQALVSQNVEKKEDICDKTEAKESTNKVKKRQITVK